MTRAIQIHEYGGPEVLRYEDIALGKLGALQLRIRHAAIGVNFIDTYERTGLYAAKLPAVLGREAAGVVVEAGRAVTKFKVGDRVAYVGDKAGAYAEERFADAARIVALPE